MKKHIKPVKGKKQSPPKPTSKAVLQTSPPPQKEISEEERIEKLLVEMEKLTIRFGHLIEQKKHRTAYMVSMEIAQISEKISGFESNETAMMYIQTANIALFIKEYAAALRHYEKSFMIIELIRPDSSIKLPDTYHGAAQAAEHLKNYDKAIKYNLQAITILKRKKWKDDTFMINLYIKINELYVHQKKYPLAILAVRKAINIQKKEDDVNILKIASCYQTIASHYQIITNISAATRNYKKSLDLLETKPNENNLEKGLLCFSISCCYLINGKYLLNLDYVKKSLVYFKVDSLNLESLLATTLSSFKQVYHLAALEMPLEKLNPYKKWFKTHFPTEKL